MLRSRLLDQRGLTLIELLVSMTLSLIVFGATLTVLGVAQRSAAMTEELNDRQQEARVAIERISRDLRNLASPSDFGAFGGTAPRGVDRNGKYDLIFKTVDSVTGAVAGNSAAVKRVRYCLDAADPTRGRVIMQEQTSDTYTSTPPADTACPGTGWTGEPRVIADHVANRINGRDRPVFAYSADGAEVAYDAPADVTATTRVDTRLWLDGRPGSSPTETRVSSGILLRNQNRPPVAGFTATVSARSITLNGSSSEDPENDPMTYAWYEGDDAATAVEIGGGTSVIHTLPARDPGSYVFLLRVTDSAGTVDWSEPVTVNVL